MSYSGLFTDPRGFEIVLRAPNELEYRQLVTKKLAQGWKQKSGQAAAPLLMEQVIAAASEPEPKHEIEEPLALPSQDERDAAVAEALAD